MTKRKRNGLFNLLFHKQPIEPGMPDPVETDLNAVRRGFTEANDNMRAAMEAFLDDLERRQKGGNKDAAPRVH